MGETLDNGEIILRLALSAVFGAVIGLERERKNWSAGMRTHMMVCLGATLIMIVSAFGFSNLAGSPYMSLDPSRIAAQVISGIGFIGAGTILFMKPGIIRGLTTASGLWTVAAIGLATGQGMYFAAGVATVLALIVLWGLKPLEKKFNRRFQQKVLHIVMNQGPEESEMLGQLLLNQHIDTVHFSYNKAKKQSTTRIRFGRMQENELAEILHRLKNDESVSEVYWSG